jgi:hypothetical protein
MKDFYVERRKDNDITIRYLSRERLPEELLRILDNETVPYGYRDKEPSAALLYLIVLAKGNDKARILAQNLRQFEKRARNIAAHEIVSVTDSWLKDKTGFNSAEILKMLKDLYSLSVTTPRDAWNSYDKLNEEIISCLAF